jgi:hypothetical protein
MTRTLRGANSRLSAKYAERERKSGEVEEYPEESEGSPAQDEEVPAPEATKVPVSDAQKAALKNFTVVQLKERLASVGLPTTGKKADLIARLLEVA